MSAEQKEKLVIFDKEGNAFFETNHPVPLAYAQLEAKQWTETLKQNVTFVLGDKTYHVPCTLKTHDEVVPRRRGEISKLALVALISLALGLFAMLLRHH